MATARVVWGRMRSMNQNFQAAIPAMDADFTSASVASGAHSAAAPADAEFASVKAIGGPMYVAVGDADGANGAPGAEPRIHLSDGEKVEIAGIRGRVISVLDAV